MGQPEQHHRQSLMLLVDRYIVTERPCFRCEVRFVRQRGSPSDYSTPLSSEDKLTAKFYTVQILSRASVPLLTLWRRQPAFCPFPSVRRWRP
jgi:hypothetical protein